MLPEGLRQRFLFKIRRSSDRSHFFITSLPDLFPCFCIFPVRGPPRSVNSASVVSSVEIDVSPIVVIKTNPRSYAGIRCEFPRGYAGHAVEDSVIAVQGSTLIL